MTDSIERPAHYCFGQMEAREIIELAIADIPDPVAAYHVATTLKYFLRTSRKGWTEDIAKGCKHAGWALDAARAHDVRESKHKEMHDGLRLGCLVGGMIQPLRHDPDSVAFRHGDIDKVCGLSNSSTTVPSMGRNGACEFTKPPNCTHPMHAVALEMADAAIPNRRSESAWAVTWPRDVSGSCEQSAAPQTEYQTLVGN